MLTSVQYSVAGGTFLVTKEREIFSRTVDHSALECAKLRYEISRRSLLERGKTYDKGLIEREHNN